MIDAGTFARLAGIGRRAAVAALALCHAGGLWRGHRLIVARAEGRGPWLVDPASLPPELAARLAAEGEPAAPPTPPTVAGDGDLPRWKLDLVQRVRHASEPGTPERMALVRRLAAETRWPDGGRRGEPIGERSLWR
jgi:hypothetical protein